MGQGRHTLRSISDSVYPLNRQIIKRKNVCNHAEYNKRLYDSILQAYIQKEQNLIQFIDLI